MRKDVKLGFAVGGVLIAVLVVYVLVVSGPATPTRSQLTRGSGEAEKSLDVTAEKAAEPAKPADTHAARPIPEPATPARPDTAKAAEPPAPVARADKQKDPFENASSQGKAKNSDLDWGKLLNGEQAVPLMTQTPVKTGEGGARQPETTPAQSSAPAQPAIPPVNSAESAGPRPAEALTPAPADSSVVAARSAEPTTRASGVRTHVVRQGENFSSIALVAYGSSKYYLAIAKANPNVDPKKLKQGMTIILPEISDLSASAEPAAARVAPTALDSSRQYKVLPGDSLHKISIKLYGRSDQADKIYQLNKDAIGADPAKVKVGQVLQLPEPPTVAVR